MNELVHFLIVVLAWVGAWGVIDGLITYIFPDSRPLARMIAYGFIMIVAVSAYAYTTPNLGDDERCRRLVV